MPGHSAYLVYQIIRRRVIQAIIPALGKKSNAQKYFSIAMIVITLFASLGIGIYLDGYVIHPPTHYTGICPPPARIHSNDTCTIASETTITNGQSTSVKIVQVNNGTIILPNSTGRH